MAWEWEWVLATWRQIHTTPPISRTNRHNNLPIHIIRQCCNIMHLWNWACHHTSHTTRVIWVMQSQVVWILRIRHPIVMVPPVAATKWNMICTIIRWVFFVKILNFLLINFGFTEHLVRNEPNWWLHESNDARRGTSTHGHAFGR